MQTQAIVQRNPEYRLTLIMTEEEAAALRYVVHEYRSPLSNKTDMEVSRTIRDEIDAMLQQAKAEEEGAQ